jgi:poly-gamma-glutamate synthesis protein (capsule biosynthesis protein)
MKSCTATAIGLLTGTFLIFGTLRSTTDMPVVEQIVPVLTDDSAQHMDEPSAPIPRLLFVGDIMLGRVVETLMDRNGHSYPFLGVEAFLLEPDSTIGNFEGVVTPVHEQAKPMTFAFSIKDSFLEHLKIVGFDVLSLANNHSNDYGPSARAYMHSRCDFYDLHCIGIPRGLDATSTLVQEINERKIGYLFIHTLYGEPSATELREIILNLRNKTDIQIAYVHWGEEYELLHSTAQETLAKTLIDTGIDAVIGHHPHVVQDIALYNGKPIFYSLGNFIFDQYFSEDVTQMIAVSMSIGSSTVAYEVTPLSGTNTQSQPHMMSETEKEVLFSRIFEDIVDVHGVNALEGHIVATFE